MSLVKYTAKAKLLTKKFRLESKFPGAFCLDIKIPGVVNDGEEYEVIVRKKKSA